MRELTKGEEYEIASALAELAKRRYAKDKDRAAAVRFSNDEIGHAIPREWYDGPEEIHLNKAAKARIRAIARQGFGEHGKHGGTRAGAGRKPTGRTVSSRTVTLPNSLWAKLDRLRGKASISRFLARKIQAMRRTK